MRIQEGPAHFHEMEESRHAPQETYQKLKQEAWPSDLQPLVADIERKFRLKMLDLLSKAYAQIRAEKAAELLGITEQEVLEGSAST